MIKLRVDELRTELPPRHPTVLKCLYFKAEQLQRTTKLFTVSPTGRSTTTKR